MYMYQLYFRRLGLVNASAPPCDHAWKTGHQALSRERAVMLDTINLILLSVKDFVFSQSAPETKLSIPAGLPGGYGDMSGSSDQLIDGGSDGDSIGASRFDPTFTDSVINTTGPKANPRIKKVIASLTRHLHDFCRENEITVDEYMAGIDMINRAGQMSTEKRNEGQLLTDVLGIESLVDEITYKLTSEATDAPTATAILGPFWRKDAPIRKANETIVSGFEDGDHTLIYGRVLDFDTGGPVQNAEVDVWHTGTNGLYEQQDPNQPDMNLRGRFYTDEDGRYNLYCLRPTKYPIPYDGPAGELLQLLDRHPYRPAHVHFIISAEGYKPIVTQIFDRRDEYTKNDVAFAVKDSLVVDFLPREGDPKAQFELEYDFKIVSYEAAKKHGMKGATELVN